MLLFSMSYVESLVGASAQQGETYASTLEKIGLMRSKEDKIPLLW